MTISYTSRRRPPDPDAASDQVRREPQRLAPNEIRMPSPHLRGPLPACAGHSRPPPRFSLSNVPPISGPDLRISDTKWRK